MPAACPACQGPSLVINSRATAKGLRRRRVCSACQGRWSTIEVDEETYEQLMRKSRQKPARRRVDRHAVGECSGPAGRRPGAALRIVAAS